MTINPMSTGQTAYESGQSVAQTDELARRAGSEEAAELRKVCDEFEAIFVKIMLDSMRDTLEEDSLIPKNSGEKLFEDRLYDQYAQKISQTAGLGIGDMMYDQLAAGLPGGVVDISEQRR